MSHPIDFLIESHTREQFEEIKEKLSKLEHRWFLYRFIRNPEVCQCFLEHFSSLQNHNHPDRGFLEFLEKERVDFLTVFLPFTSILMSFSVMEEQALLHVHISGLR